MQLVDVPIFELVVYENNSRIHSDEQIEQIASSIREFGFTNPVLINENNRIIAGHGRYMAARMLDMTAVPCITLTGLTEAQERAYVIADNKLALNARWDEDLLKIELSDLQTLDVDAALLGFIEDDLVVLGIGVEAEWPNMDNGEKPPYCAKTFTLHDDQIQWVDDALILARTKPEIDIGVNDNANGNAITFICKQWLKWETQKT